MEGKKRTQLVFKGISEIVGGNGMAVIVLTDVDEKRAISVVCDSAMKYQIGMRNSDTNVTGKFLPEVMTRMLGDFTDIGRYEITIHGIVGGEYKTAVMNADTFDLHQIRISDAVLLSLITGIPIYIDTQLMYRQSSIYNGKSDRMSIPINTLDTDKLKEELDKAVETENYRLASQIKEELNKRETV